MKLLLIFIGMFIIIPLILYVSAKNNFAGGKYNKKHK